MSVSRKAVLSALVGRPVRVQQSMIVVDGVLESTLTNSGNTTYHMRAAGFQVPGFREEDVFSILMEGSTDGGFCVTITLSGYRART